MKHICASILVVALITTVAEAQTVRQVPSSYPTIQAAIAAAQSGDTVRVAPGTYVENINFLGKAITVVSIAGPDVTIIDGNAAGSVVTFTTNEGLSSVLEGFTLRNGKVTSIDGGGIRISAASPTVRRNQILKNSSCNGVGIAINNGSPLIQGNVIRDNTSTGCTNGGGGILVFGTGSAQILDNTISNNTAYHGGGISLASSGAALIRGNIITGNTGTRGGGISMLNFSDAKIIQNVVAANTASERGGGIYWLVNVAQHSASITNNSVVDNNASQQGSGIYADGLDGFNVVKNNLIIAKTGQPAIHCGNNHDSNPPVLEFNNVFAAQAAAYSGICSDVTGVNGNISAAPLFTDSASRNFRLLDGSPGINAGNNVVSDLPTLDLDSVPRILPSGGAVDMGAYEFAKVTTSTISPSTLTFADQTAGTVSAPLDVTLTNTGSEILVVRSITLNGEFSQTNTCQPASGVGAGQSCTISIRFTPSAGGPRSGQLTVSGNWGAGNTVTLSGNGLGALSLSTAPIAFGDQRVGSLSAPAIVTVSNTGSGALDISSIATTGEFTSSTDCPASLPASSACTIDVRFGPVGRGPRVGALTLTTSATGSPHVVLLSGNGIAPTITLTPSSLSFPSLPIGGTSSPLTVTVSNQGDLPLLISSI